LAATLRADGRAVVCVTQHLPRPEFLALFRRARVAIALPTRAEGFFLPPMEAMANGCITICPDVPGTRHYRDGEGCFRSTHDHAAILAAAGRALALDPVGAAQVLKAGMRFVRARNLDTERERVIATLDEFDEFVSAS